LTNRLVQSAFLWTLIGLTFGSGALYLSGHEGYWATFTTAYILTLIVYTGYLLALLFYHELRPPRYPAYTGQAIAVLIPCFNEEPGLAERSIRSVFAAAGKKQVIVIDDGSTNGVSSRLRELAAELPMTLHVFPENRGKREALHYAVTHLLDNEIEYVVTIDSDTVVDDQAFALVCAPLSVEGIGAATGNVLLLNEKRNLVTRAVGAYYWIGLQIHKQAQSVIRSVVCCSGCLSAYRADLLREVIDEFAAQVFLGEKCTHSEDRHLTNLVLRRRLGVVYVPEAVSWTETPFTVGSFAKQQMRWKRGYVRESFLTLSYGWRVKKLLWLQILCWDLTSPFLSLGVRISFFAVLFTTPAYGLVLVVTWAVLGLMRYAMLPLHAPRKLPGFFVYLLLNEVVLYWVNLWALLTVKNKSWVTRGQPTPALSGGSAVI
jgi:cellulose synthase/poly-beta-1,6-N-acetylglucosamine synthase-like glycosyltransferase